MITTKILTALGNREYQLTALLLALAAEQPEGVLRIPAASLLNFEGGEVLCIQMDGQEIVISSATKDSLLVRLSEPRMIADQKRQAEQLETAQNPRVAPTRVKTDAELATMEMEQTARAALKEFSRNSQSPQQTTRGLYGR